MKIVYKLFLVTAIWALLSFGRLALESKQKVVSRFSGATVGSQYDPRGFARLDKIIKDRESAAFKDRLRRGIQADFGWPGLKSAQVAWTWLEVLSGLHHPSSYDGDFSWMFSKLNTLAGLSDKRELRFLTGLAPFFLVLGKDHAGASLLVQEIITRGANEYNPWFHAGFHALENLSNRTLAADYYLRASQFPFAPPYLAALHARLKFGNDLGDPKERRALLLREIRDEGVIKRIKQARPEWFE